MGVVTTAREWGADAWMGASWKLRYARHPRESIDLADGTRAPVLVIPGVHETWHFMRPIALHLHGAGHPVHVLPQLGHNVAPIPDSAAFAQRYLDDNDLEHVVIVGHSKGGLIGKHMMAVDDTAHRITALVAITTPFAGSSLAKFSPIPSLREFRGNAPTVATLRERSELNDRITSIYGTFDPMIPERSRLEGARNVEIAVGGHFRPLVSPEVLRIVERAVAGD